MQIGSHSPVMFADILDDRTLQRNGVVLCHKNTCLQQRLVIVSGLSYVWPSLIDPPHESLKSWKSYEYWWHLRHDRLYMWRGAKLLNQPGDPVDIA